MNSFNHEQGIGETAVTEEFIDGVWCKVRYLEWKQQEELAVKRRKMGYRRLKRALGVMLFLLSAAAALPLFVMTGPSMGSLIFSGIAFLAAGSAYECLPDMKFFRRISHGN